MSIVFLGTIRGDIGFDSVISESIQADVTVTKHPIEVGADIADHIYVNPATINMKVIVSYTTLEGSDDPFASTLASGASRPQNAYRVLEEIKAAGKSFTVVTGMKIFSNMVLTSVSVDRDATTANVMIADLVLNEIFVVDTQLTILPASKLSVPGKASQVNNGQIAPKQTESILFGWLG